MIPASTFGERLLKISKAKASHRKGDQKFIILRCSVLGKAREAISR
jgi:hypothetical protein